MSRKSTFVTMESDDSLFKKRIATEELTKSLGLKSDISGFLQTRHTSDEIVQFLTDNESKLTGACWLHPLEDDDTYDIVEESPFIIKLEWFESNKPVYTIGSHFYVIFTGAEGIQIPDGMFIIILYYFSSLSYV